MENLENVNQCGCRNCLRERGETIGGRPVELCRMIVCETCGNKRCPHATDHRHECTHSNEPGQKGSAWENVPPAGNRSQASIAEQIAREAHAGQFRRDWVTPYIQHPEAVARRLSGESDEVIATAWLHDVLEDTDRTPEHFSAAGISMEVIKSVSILTHRSDEPYGVYLQNVKSNHIARRVKIADMICNLADKPSPMQVLKYARGLLVLVEE